MPDNGSNLAVALVKAQADFGTVKRDKKVTVKTKTGGSYSFAYAPLESILEAVRKPLADNGLVVVQMLDDGGLTTLLLHESGERLGGTVGLPATDDIQGFGSAITYLRRYAIQALLGIAAEEDDDGNRASGHIAAPQAEPTVDPDGSLIGTVEIGKPPVDMSLRETPDGHVFGFKLKNGRKAYQVVAEGALARALADVASVTDFQVGHRATVWGSMDMVPWQKDGRDMPPYPRIRLERIQTAEFTLPADEAESAPLWDAEALTDVGVE